MEEILHTAKNIRTWEDFVSKDRNAVITFLEFDHYAEESLMDSYSDLWAITYPNTGEDLGKLSRVHYPIERGKLYEFIVQDIEGKSVYTVLMSGGLPIRKDIVNCVFYDLNHIFDEEFVYHGRSIADV